MKRLFDLVVSLGLILTLFPVIIIVGIVVRLGIGSPIIFKQKRPGLHGKPFYLYKFRTMNNKTDSFGSLLPDDVRLTPLGRFLRRLSLDELPQLINVIRGDLSLVGPRPLLMEYLPLYTNEQAKRHYVRPGITGWAQVNGRNSISWEEKFQMDVWYVNNHSFILDIKILILTVVKVVRSEGINQPGKATIERFKGTNSM